MAPKQQRTRDSDEETLVLSPNCQADREEPSVVSDDPRDVPEGGFVILSDGTTAGSLPQHMMSPTTMNLINNMMGLLNRGRSSNSLGGHDGDSQVSPVMVFMGNESQAHMEEEEEEEEGDDPADGGEAAASSTTNTTSEPKSKAKGKASKKKKGKRQGK